MMAARKVQTMVMFQPEPVPDRMRPLAGMSNVLLLLVAPIPIPAAQAQPVISAGGVLSAASYASPGWPDSDIAQGSLFAVFGQRLGPATLQTARSFPFPRNWRARRFALPRAE